MLTNKSSVALSATLLTLCVALISVEAIAVTRHYWESWRVATCMSQEANCFCEQLRSSGMRQPVNTLSGFSFVWVGFLVLLQELKRRKSVTDRHEHLALFRLCFAGAFPASLVLVGLGTAFYHATLTFVGQSFDIIGMYLIALLLITYRLARFLDWRPKRATVLFVSATIPLLFWASMCPSVRRYIFAALIVAILTCEFLFYKLRSDNGHYPVLLAAVGSLALGHLFWQLDYHGVWCNPLGYYQGHAMWHLLGAASAYLAYRFYRSELRAEH